MKQEIESVVPMSNCYRRYMGRIGEMEENAKIQDGSNELLSISRLNKLNVLLYFVVKLWLNIVVFLHCLI